MMATSPLRIRLGTRGSKLALWQTRHVAKLLRERYPGITIEEVLIKTLGDRVTDMPLFKVGGQGLFVAEIERALQERRIDVAVHSLKDLPHAEAEGLCLAAVTAREDGRDALLSKSGLTLENLPGGAKIGTSSLRRRAQLARLRPDLAFVDCRGNLDTRLRKLDDGEFDAIILAAAGLRRLGWADRIVETFPPEMLIPAAGQGMLGIQCRTDDQDLVHVLAEILEEPHARACATAERAFLHRLQGGCQTPMGIYAEPTRTMREVGRRRPDGAVQPDPSDDTSLKLTAFAASPDGAAYCRAELSGPESEADHLGRRIAEILLETGAADILPLTI